MEKKSSELWEPKNRVISGEFKKAIKAAAKQPQRIMAAAVNYNVLRFTAVVEGRALGRLDIWPLVKLAQL